MKTRSFRFLALVLLVLLAALTVTACKGDGESSATEEQTTLPEVIETIPDEPGSDTEPASTPVDTLPETEPVTEPVTEPDVRFTSFPAAALPDYAQFVNEARVNALLADTSTVTVCLGSTKLYRGAVIQDLTFNAVTKDESGNLLVDVETIGEALGIKCSGEDLMTPFRAADKLGVSVTVYDGKMVMFSKDGELFDVHDDMYTLEAIWLYLTDASEEDIVNAFIDLPDVVSNGKSSAMYYSAPDLNLGIQSSVYYAQLGKNVEVGPRLVAGEGRYTDDKNPNHTVVRVFNEQQAMTTQFLAYDASVTGGVQVAAAGVGSETLICTSPFAAYDGPDGDVRVFDIFGVLRMDIKLREVMAGPYTIVTGRFVSGKTDDVLLVTGETIDAEGRLPYALIDLSTGTVIARSTLDCSFGLPKTEGARGVVSLSVRTGADGNADTLILYFPEARAVYEGSPVDGTFTNAGITVPESANGVFASSVPGERYIITMAEAEETVNRSFISVIDTDADGGRLMDVGFRENVFYTNSFWNDNYDTYVSTGHFSHIRTDLSNGVMGQLGSANTSEKVDAVFDGATYATYTFGGLDGWVRDFKTGHYFLEPCFTHRWNKISATANLVNYVDADSGQHTYVSIGESGQYEDYLELGSSFFIGTYADGILDLAKLRLYPLRSFLRTLAVAFRGPDGIPENLVGVSPVHEQEIAVGDAVGDYNEQNIRGFQIYMMEQYGSVEHINTLFDTAFESEYDIDPPRKAKRGDWDKYSGDYFDQWMLYNRYVVSKRIMEAYREALVAGYPPESISAHSIPEGEAVGGLLGQAGTRISPVDVVTTCGTAYGGTRYGIFYKDNNFIQNANRAGQWNISIGEYCAMDENTKSASQAYAQLKYLWSHGVRMIHQLPFNDKQNTTEYMAIQKLGEENQPRPGYTGGTTGAVGVLQGGSTYNIIQMGEGAGSDNQGLLKSVTADGKWEGTVYVVPFHAHVGITVLDALNAPMEGTTNVYSTGVLPFLKNSDVVELTLKASYAGAGRAYVTFEVYNKGYLMPASAVTFELTGETTPYRYVLDNQIYIDGAEVRMTLHTEGGDESAITVSDFKGTLQKDAVAVKFVEGSRGTRNALAHSGGVTFDVIDRDMKH